jgi:hypothetical protein
MLFVLNIFLNKFVLIKNMVEKKPANVPAIVLLILGAVFFVFLISFVYMSLNGKNYSSIYTQKISTGEVPNPINSFSLFNGTNANSTNTITINTSQGPKTIIIKMSSFNYTLTDVQKQIVNYASVILKLYNLHNIPFTTIPPKVQIYIDENAYFVEISGGNIIIYDGVIDSPDLVIRTSSDNILSALQNKESLKDVISSGKISIDLVANKFILFTKGYLGLYNEFSK